LRACSSLSFFVRKDSLRLVRGCTLLSILSCIILGTTLPFLTIGYFSHDPGLERPVLVRSSCRLTLRSRIYGGLRWCFLHSYVGPLLPPNFPLPVTCVFSVCVFRYRYSSLLFTCVRTPKPSQIPILAEVAVYLCGGAVYTSLKLEPGPHSEHQHLLQGHALSACTDSSSAGEQDRA